MMEKSPKKARNPSCYAASLEPFRIYAEFALWIFFFIFTFCRITLLNGVSLVSAHPETSIPITLTKAAP
jgi:hypothetical protein